MRPSAVRTAEAAAANVWPELTRVKNAGGGNCLFAAMAQAMQQIVRQFTKAVAYVQQHKRAFVKHWDKCLPQKEEVKFEDFGE